MELRFPEEWDVRVSNMRDAPDISDTEIRRAFENPIGTPRVAELAKGKQSVVIAVDDLNRPTQTYRLMPFILEELASAGIAEERVLIIFAIGAHRPMMREDMIKKLGIDMVDRFAIVNHHIYENLAYLGETSHGTPINVNNFFVDADLRIGVGFISPHPLAGFGGGGKIVLPGLAGADTIQLSHGRARTEKAGGLGSIEGNEPREEIEEVARKAGLDAIVNTVGNSSGKTAGVFVGDSVDAHRAGVQLAQQVYATEVPQNLDIGVFNAFPMDTEFDQCVKALNVWSKRDEAVVNEDGAVVVTSAGSEGRGFYWLTHRVKGLYWRRDIGPNRKLIFFCPNIGYADLYERYPKHALFFRRWEDVVEELSKQYGTGSKVGVFPCGSIQLSSVLYTSG